MLFAREALGLEVWERQAEILMAAAVYAAVAVRSGHKIGKSLAAAIIAIWWTCTRTRPLVIMTSAGQTQVKEILWTELRRLREQRYRPERERVFLGGKFNDDPKTGWVFPDRKILGFTTNEKERMAGFSGDELLYIPDEGSGIDEEIFEAIEGNRAGGAHIVMFSNPTQTSGYFYEVFNNPRMRKFWHLIHVSSEETPNAKTGRMVVPGLANKDWIDERREAWGEESALYQVRVKGNFPTQGTNAVIGLAIMESAVERWAATEAEGQLELGVDVAEDGDDDSVVIGRRGRKVIRIETFQGRDPVQLAAEVRRIAEELEPEQDGVRAVVRVKVDSIGIGSGTAATLRAYDLPWLEVVRVNAAESPYQTETQDGELKNVRAELWTGCRDWLKDGAIPNDEMLKGELIAPTYLFDTQGRMLIEKKKDIKKRLKRSPDRADALCLAVYSPPSTWFI